MILVALQTSVFEEANSFVCSSLPVQPCSLNLVSPKRGLLKVGQRLSGLTLRSSALCMPFDKQILFQAKAKLP
jgi:hypothetical protein